MQIAVQLTGDDAVLAMLKRTRDGLIDLRAPLRQATAYLKRYYSGVAYASRGSVFGSRWPSLSPGYEIQKLKRWGSRPMLIASGQMRAGYRDEVHPMTARIYNDVRHFPFHQRGTSKMPVRVTLGVNATLETEVNRIVNDHVRRELARAV